MKKFFALILSIAMMMSCFCFSSYAADASFINYDPSGVKECTDPSDIFNFVLCDGHESAPIRIVPATLTKDGETEDIYLVGLVGSENQKGQVNVWKNIILSAFSIPNSYADAVKEAVKDNIPEGSKIVFAGHSLGGMVAQQVIADSDFTGKYEILYTITAGSPYIITGEKAGVLNRLCDKYDAAPWLSCATLLNPVQQIAKRQVEDGGYLFDPDGAHNLSYRRTEVWNGYDAVGIKGGNTVITFDFADLILVGRVEADA